MSDQRTWRRRRRVLLVAWMTLAMLSVALIAAIALSCRYVVHEQYGASRPTYGSVVSVFRGRLYINYESGIVPGYSGSGLADRWYWPEVLPRGRWSGPDWWVRIPFWPAALLCAGAAWWLRRRWKRVRIAGICASCGYEVGALAVCPECGTAAPQGRAEAGRVVRSKEGVLGSAGGG